MDTSVIVLISLLVYTGGLVITGGVLDGTKYIKQFNTWYYCIFYPITVILILTDLLKTKQIKQMNYKILGKAMGFMFAPTLGILLMLLVGFFDPIAMWTFIKSDTAGAVITRLVMFVLEVGFVIGLYVSYMEEESKKEIVDQINSDNIGNSKKVSHNDYLSRLITRDNYDDEYVYYDTHNPNMKIIERKPKK